MILAIDIGNTNIVLGCIDGDKTLFVERLSTVRTKTELEYAIDIKNVLDIYHIHRDEIEVRVMSHKSNPFCLGVSYVVEAQYFEKIGHIKPFNREEVLELIAKGNQNKLNEYDEKLSNSTNNDEIKDIIRDMNNIYKDKEDIKMVKIS